MAKSVLNANHFQDEAAAFAYVEAKLWPNGPVCPFCQSGERVGRMSGKTTRPGLCKCYACRKPFTVRQGSIFESSHLPLHLWLQVIHLMCASKKGISTRQIQRMLSCSMKTAWFLTHRIREAMAPNLEAEGPLGSGGEAVEIDETFFGNRPEVAVERGSTKHKHAIVSLVQRGGKVRSFPVADVRSPTLHNVIAANVSPLAHINTDERSAYKTIGWNFASHEVVTHSADEYVRGTAYTNTVEGVFSIFKRGMVGTYQHCGEQHLHRYLAEFDFRYSNRVAVGVNDVSRASIALKGMKGKRLTYRTTRATVPF